MSAQLSRKFSRREALKLSAMLGAGSVLAACASPAPTSAPRPAEGATTAPAATQPPAATAAPQTVAEILMTFWGSPMEKESMLEVQDSFNASHPNIKATCEHIPSAYAEKITTMLAGGTPPDLAYSGESMAEKLAVEGHLLDLAPIFDPDPVASQYLPQLAYHYAGKYIGTGIAGTSENIYYNRDVFDAAGLPYPPSKAEEAWTWDEFLEVCKQLTTDANGKTAADPGFDAENVDVYGLTYDQGGYFPWFVSNGAKFANEDATALLLNEPPAVEVLQNMADLVWVYHVSPTPAQVQTLPATDVLMQSGKMGMAIDGTWKILDYSQLDMNWGMGVLPKFKEPRGWFFCAPTIVFAATKYPNEVGEFYKYQHDPAQCNLFQKGLWMPVSADYYTEEPKIKAWLEGIPGVFPPEARDVMIGFIYGHSPEQPPAYWLKNQAQIFGEAVNPALTRLFAGEATAQEAADQAVEAAAPFMQGRWT